MFLNVANIFTWRRYNMSVFSAKQNQVSVPLHIVKNIFLIIMVLVLFPINAICGSEKFTDSDDYKDKDFKKGIITDYSDLQKGDDIDWLWVMPGTKLADHKVKIVKFENLSDDLRKSQFDEIKGVFNEVFDKLKGSKSVLSADLSVYEVQKFSAGKAWIPFAGGHQMQAGAGIEMVLKDNGKVVAKIRHFAREGSRIEDAAQEVAEDLKKYISKH